MPYSPQEFTKIVDWIIKGYNQKLDRFLDERQAEWSAQVGERFRKEAVGFEGEGEEKERAAQERLQLLKHIICENEKYCRRDMIIPMLEFEQQMGRIEELVNRRVQDGLTDSHPTILSEEANILMLVGEYSKAQSKLDSAIEANEKLGDMMAKRDNVRFLGDYVRCLYMQNEFEAAIENADQARILASEIPADKEEDELNSVAAAPGLQFIPVAVHAYFAACDARINHKEWKDNERLQLEFTGLWSDAVSNYHVPDTWRTPMKIAVVSDKMWASRMESYVQDIAEQLYVDLARTSRVKIIRLVRTKWGSFSIDYGKSAAAAALLIVFLFGSGPNNPLNPPVVSAQEIQRVLNTAGVDADAKKLEDSIYFYLPSDSNVINDKELLDPGIQDRDLDTPSRSPVFRTTSSGSESSVRGV